MQGVPINGIAVLVCGVISMILGYLWYGPLFGKPWMALSGMKKDAMKKMDPSKMAVSYGLMFIGALVMSFVLAHAMVFALAYLNMSGFAAGLTGGFWNWLGFVAPVSLGVVLWEGKSWKLWMINSGYYLVFMLIAGAIFATWK